jgi:hypothetical protein
MKGEVNGSPRDAKGDVGKSAPLKGDNDAYYMGGVAGLGVKSAGAGNPTPAADLKRKGKS